MEKAIILILIVIALGSVYIYLASRTDTFTGRWVAWKSSGVDDYLLFPAHKINHAPPAYYFNKEEQHFFLNRLNTNIKENLTHPIWIHYLNPPGQQHFW